MCPFWEVLWGSVQFCYGSLAQLAVIYHRSLSSPRLTTCIGHIFVVSRAHVPYLFHPCGLFPFMYRTQFYVQSGMGVVGGARATPCSVCSTHQLCSIWISPEWLHKHPAYREHCQEASEVPVDLMHVLRGWWLLPKGLYVSFKKMLEAGLCSISC